MAHLNKAMLIGNAGDAPKVKEINGNTVIQFDLATSRTYSKKDGEKVAETVWHRIEYWSPSEKMASLITKGTPLYVEGSIAVDDFTGRDGNRVRFTKIKATVVQILGGKDTDARREQPRPAAPPAFEMEASSLEPSDHPDDLPF